MTATFIYQSQRLACNRFYQLRIIVTNNSFGSSISHNMGSQNGRIIQYGNKQIQYSLDDLLIAPAMMDFKIFDGNRVLQTYLFPALSPYYPIPVNSETIDVSAKVELWKGDDRDNLFDLEFSGHIEVESLSLDNYQKIISFRAITKTDILNETTLYDENGNPKSFVSGIDDEGQIQLPDFIKMIYKLVNPNINVTVDCDSNYSFIAIPCEASRDSSLHFQGLTNRSSARISGFTINDLCINAYWLKNVVLKNCTNVGDILRKLAFDFGAITGMISENQAFFSQLYTAKNVYTPANEKIISILPKYNKRASKYLELKSYTDYKNNNGVLTFDGVTPAVLKSGSYNDNDSFNVKREILPYINKWAIDGSFGDVLIYGRRDINHTKYFYDIPLEFNQTRQQFESQFLINAMNFWKPLLLGTNASRVVEFTLKGTEYNFLNNYFILGGTFKPISANADYTNNITKFEAIPFNVL